MNPPGHTAWDGNGPCGHGGINCASDEHLAKGNEARTIKSGSHGCQPPARRTESVWALVIAPEGLLPHRRDVPVDQCLEWPQQLGAELRASEDGQHLLGCVHWRSREDWEATWDCGATRSELFSDSLLRLGARSIHFDSFLVAERLA